jgi:hypothetical protein
MKTVKPAFTAEDNYGEMSADEMVDRMFEFAAADGSVCIPVWNDETDAPCKEDEYRSIKLKWTLEEKEAFKSEFEDMTSKLFAAMDMLHLYAGNDVADALQKLCTLKLLGAPDIVINNAEKKLAQTMIIERFSI